jgi:hypothetical protein
MRNEMRERNEMRDAYSRWAMTYDLRRLRRHGLIQRSVRSVGRSATAAAACPGRNHRTCGGFVHADLGGAADGVLSVDPAAGLYDARAHRGSWRRPRPQSGAQRDHATLSAGRHSRSAWAASRGHRLLWIGPRDAQADDGAALQVMDDGVARRVVGQVLVGELG